MLNNLEKKISRLKKNYQRKYGLAVFDVEIKECKKGLVIEGTVLTKNQRDEVLNLVESIETSSPISEFVSMARIKILSDPKQRNEIGWATVKNRLINVKSRFVSNKILNNKILKRIICSQGFRNEILRVLYRNEDQLLVQQRDGTLGWTDKKDVIMKRKNLPKLQKEWLKQYHTLDYDTRDKILLAGAGKNKIIEEAKKYLGAPYLLGGKTKKGIDCSGLVQMAYQNSLGIILPRHSRDQRKFGRKIRLTDSEAGDLVFFEKLKNKTSHVGLVCENKPDNFLIIHSCRENKGVKIQKLEKVLEKYKVVEVRKIVED